MIKIRKAHERGHFDLGWLNTYHTFSFDRYYDPNNLSFRSLRVINEDFVAPGRGFPPHSHRDMEIVTYVLDGELQHEDSMGNGSIIRPGEVQRMSAGTGVTHSEANPSESSAVHLLQIWILPTHKNLTPEYEQKFFGERRRGKLCLIASEDARDDSVTIQQDARIFATVLDSGQSVRHELLPGRHAWIQVARGDVELNGHELRQGDGAAISEESVVNVSANSSSEVLLFDLG